MAQPRTWENLKDYETCLSKKNFFLFSVKETQFVIGVNALSGFSIHPTKSCPPIALRDVEELTHLTVYRHSMKQFY
jgi:hypothetical protein